MPDVPTSSYPTGYDVFDDPTTNLAGPPLHSNLHKRLADAIEKLEAEVGLSPSAAYATVTDRLLPMDVNTGRQAITVASGFTGNLEYHRMGLTNFLDIQLSKSGSNISATNATIGTVPATFSGANLRPSTFWRSVVSVSNPAAVFDVQVSSSGIVQINLLTANVGATIRGQLVWPVI